MTLVLATSALLSGAVVWFGAFSRKEAAALPSPQIVDVQAKTVRVLVASRTVFAGEQITPASYTHMDFSMPQAGAAFLKDTPINRASLSALMAPRMIPAGTPFVTSDIAAPVPAPVSPFGTPIEPVAQENPEKILHLSPGMRAIALPVTPETSVAGLLKNGDRVDVLLSFQHEADTKAIRTVLRNVRIIATDLKTGQAGAEADDPPKIITFELTSEGAQVLALAQQMGSLLLVLSSAREGEAPIISEEMPIFSSQISGATKESPPVTSRESVTVVRGASSQINVLVSANPQPPQDATVLIPEGVPQATIVAVPSSQVD